MLSEAKHLGFIALGSIDKSPEILHFAQNDNLQVAWNK